MNSFIFYKFLKKNTPSLVENNYFINVMYILNLKYIHLIIYIHLVLLLLQEL